MLSAGGPLSGNAYFLHWGVVQISLPNLIVILIMVALFVLALVLPFPGGHDDAPTTAPTSKAHDDHS